MILLFLFLFSLPSLLPAGAFPRTLEAFPGKTPQIDGKLAPGEWDDATAFTGVLDWVPQFTRTEDPRDLALRGWVKHDDRRLYFAFEVTECYRIRDGKLAEPLRGATLVGQGPKLMSEIDMVGWDLGYSTGTCGKDGQGAPVADAQPTFRIPSVVIGGKIQ